MKYSLDPVKSYFLRFQEFLGFSMGSGYWAPPKPWKRRLCAFLGVEPADRWIRKPLKQK
jgi:hypothetical protein